MNKIQDLYHANIRPMLPAERLELARLILDDLAPSAVAIDESDTWGDEDVAELATFSARHADQTTKP